MNRKNWIAIALLSEEKIREMAEEEDNPIAPDDYLNAYYEEIEAKLKFQLDMIDAMEKLRAEVAKDTKTKEKAE
jgi:hypothetical protein